MQELKAQVASASERGHAQRFELWTTLLPDIKAAIEKVLKDDQVTYENGSCSVALFIKALFMTRMTYCSAREIS